MTLALDLSDVGTSLLRQGTYWKIRQWGVLQLVTIDSLTPDHRARLLDWLRANASLMQAHEARQIVTSHRRRLIGDQEFAAEMRKLEDVDPREWIDNTVLVRRLVELVPRKVLARRGLLRRWRR